MLLGYSSQAFALRRPIPCPKGTYCHPGTAINETSLRFLSTPQPCFESMYCPEGSAEPSGLGECPKGHYCPFSNKIPCPAGTFCPRTGLLDPLHCEPGTFNFMVGQLECSICPRGFACPGYGRM